MHLRPAFAVLAAVIVAMSASAMVNHSPTTPGAGTTLPTVGHSVFHPGAPSTPAIPAPAGRSSGPGILPVALTVIEPNGSISNATAPITRDQATNSYTLTGSFTGGILDERNGSSLVGAGKTLTTDTSLSETVEVFQAANVNISGLTINGAGEGIFVEGSSGVSISNVNLSIASWAVDAEYSSSVTVSHVDAQGSNGIYGYEITGLWVSNTNVSSTSDGVYLEYGSDFTVTNTSAYDSDDGVDADYASNVFLWGDNLSDTDDGVELYLVTHAAIEWCLGFETDYFLYAEYTSDLNVQHNSAPRGDEPIDLEDDQNVVINAFNAPVTFEDAAYLEYSTNVTFTNVNLTQCSGSYTLYVEEGSNLRFTHLNVSSFYEYGLYLEDSLGVWVTDSNASSGTYSYPEGIYTDDDVQVSITDSTAWNDAYAFEDYGTTNLSVVGNDFSHTIGTGEAVYIEEDSNVQFLNNDLFNASDYGFENYETNQLTVIGNNISWAGDYGIYTEYSSGVVLMHNTVTNSGEYGLYMDEDSSSSVLDNSFGYLHYLYSEAIELEECSGVTLEGNTAQHANYSLYVDDSTGILFENNNDSNSYYGAYLDYDSNTTIVGNEFATDHNGFVLDGGLSGTLFYHNNFVGDAGWLNYNSVEMVAWADGYPTGGNFWSNHTSPDTMSGPAQNVAGSDGIVDTPFVINATMQDPYPLTAPWVTHTATFMESGLSAGTLWGVSVGGGTWWSTTASIVYLEPNAANTTYGYTVGHVTGYHPANPATGSVPADRSDATVHVAFTGFNYTVTFQETGLKSGVTWTLAVNGGTLTGSSSSIVTTAVNGTWSYVPEAVTGYALTTAPGNVTVNGAPATVTVNYVLINSSTGNSGNSGTTSTSSTGYSANEVYGLAAGLIIALLLAIIGFALWAGARRPKQPSGAAQWTPPPAGPAPPMPPPSGGAPPAGGSPPPGAMGGS